MTEKTITYLKSALSASNAYLVGREAKTRKDRLTVRLMQKTQIEQHVLEAVLQSLEGDHGSLSRYTTLYELIKSG
jgi:hypothetical protein